MRSIRCALCVLALITLAGAPTRAAPAGRGDADGSGGFEPADVVLLLRHLYAGGPAPACAALGDANGDGASDIADVLSLLFHLFRGRPGPAALSAFEARICLPPDEVDSASAARGMLVYENPTAGGNSFACATCHDILPDGATDRPRRPGHSLLGAMDRPSWKNGQLRQFLDAVNVCRYDWLVAERWQAEDPEFLDLASFLRQASGSGPRPALSYEIAASSRSGPSTADAAAGCETFHRTCFVCHGPGASGTERAPPLVFEGAPPLRPDYIRSRVRLSGNSDSVYGPLLGGVMPFWSLDRLSDLELEQIVAWLTARPQPACEGSDPDPDGGGGPGPDPGGEGKVLRRGSLATRFHGVSGVAEELDSRKIRLRDFNYDGGGIVVRVWLYKQGDIRNGYPIGPDLRKAPPGYVDATVSVEIPPAITSKMFDSVSIWCETARVSFGDGPLGPP